MYSSLALDSQNLPRISYHDDTNGDLKYAKLVNNEPPTVEAGGPYSGNEGYPITLNATASDPENDELTTLWSHDMVSADPGATCAFGDPNQLDTTFTCTGDSTGTLTLHANDGFNPQVMASAAVTVSNVAPTVSLGDNVVEFDEGDPYTGSGSFSDPGTHDTHAATVNYGDGLGLQPLTFDPDGNFTLNHTYLDDGPYQVAVCVEDDDQESGCNGVQVTVRNVAPDITKLSVDPTGSQVMVTVTATDPAGVNDPLSYAFDCDNDDFYEIGPQPDNSATCLFGNQKGSFQINVQVNDDDGGEDNDSVTATLATELCASNYTGVLRYSATCRGHETAITIPDESGPVTVCASRHNGPLRLPASGICAGHETTYVLPEDGPLSVCVSNYTHAMRVIGNVAQCSRHEHGRLIAATEVGEVAPPRAR